LLRTLTYLQVDSGEFAGNVVLWMQADGTLNRSAAPVELPDPSDSDESYWLARTIWALGEAVPVYAAQDPDFAAFLIDPSTWRSVRSAAPRSVATATGRRPTAPLCPGG